MRWLPRATADLGSAEPAEQPVADLVQFEKEVTAWLDANCPRSLRVPAQKPEDLVYGGQRYEFPSEDAKVWMELMVGKGWTVPTWSRQYGGAGLSNSEAQVLQRAMRKLGCRAPLSGHGIWMLGPALMEFGTERQRLDHLPRIARGEIRWSQGYSEPGAGSDLASLRCKCEDMGDHYLVNGQKCWTTDGHRADWIFVLVRTDPDSAVKQSGISFLLIDMSSPGVTARPVQLINGETHFADTFFDNVAVPKENLVGELHAGWQVAKGLLVHERTMMSQLQEVVPKPMAGVVECARRYLPTAHGSIADPVMRDRITQHLMNNRSMEIAQRRAGEEARIGKLDKTTTTYFKAYATEEDKRRDELFAAVMGNRAMGWEGEGFTEAELKMTRLFYMGKSLSIGGGTTEVQWNLVAKSLGLPEPK